MAGFYGCVVAHVTLYNHRYCFVRFIVSKMFFLVLVTIIQRFVRYARRSPSAFFNVLANNQQILMIFLHVLIETDKHTAIKLISLA